MDFTKSLISKKLFWVALFYLALLFCSSIYRSQISEKNLPKSKSVVFLNTIDGDQKLEKKIRFAYQDTGRELQTDNLPVILVHGSPGSSEAFDGLAKLISDRRIISVDLPGFGDSSSNVPDYSIYAHSKYLAALMDKLEIEKAHLVGFSLGGGVILHLAEEDPKHAESLTFIASIGVQEYELLGSFRANRIVHSAQLAFFWFLQNLTPHFGIFDGMMMSYARNFFDTDQRPLRNILEKIEKPFLILHGKDDPLVPVEAAREHARLVPQSDYHELDDNHFFVFMRPQKIEQTLKNFWVSVEKKTAKTRQTADPARIERSQKPFTAKILKAKGATVFVFCLIILILAFVNEDIAFLAAGFLAGQGRFSLTFAIPVSTFAAFSIIFLVILVGRFSTKKTNRDTSSSNGFFGDLKRKPFRFRLIDYFKVGKSSADFLRNLLKFFAITAIWAVVLNCTSYLLARLIY